MSCEMQNLQRAKPFKFPKHRQHVETHVTKIGVFCGVTPRSQVKIWRRFTGKYIVPCSGTPYNKQPVFQWGLTFYDTTNLPLLRWKLQVTRRYKIYTLYFGGELRSATQPDFLYWGGNFRFWDHKIYTLYFGGGLTFCDTTRLPLLRWDL
jgi:hypothetical protein